MRMLYRAELRLLNKNAELRKEEFKNQLEIIHQIYDKVD
jgi:hypothetical protein